MTPFWKNCSHILQGVHWHSCSIQSHALALFIIYFVYHYPWGWQNRDKLLKPPGKKSGKSYSEVKDKRKDKTSPIIDKAEAEDQLAEACPEATPAERKRFLAARQGNFPAACKLLKNYLEWNESHLRIAKEHDIRRPRTKDRDLDIWTEACQVAMRAKSETADCTLPRVVRTHKIKSTGKNLVDIRGHRIVQIIPARMDVTLASSSTYALAVSLYLNSHLARNGEERIVVCMDARAGRGWPNTHAMRLIPFMQQTTTLLLALFPERLYKCLVYPVPSSFLWIWTAISKVVDPVTRDKICVLGGPNKIEAPPPFEQMHGHMPPEAANELERSRVASFIDD